MSRLFASTFWFVLGLLLVTSPAIAAGQSAGALGSQYPRDPLPKSIDVVLGANRDLRGTLVDRQGRPVVDAQVEVLPARGLHAIERTNTRGQFHFSQLSSGEVTLRVGRQIQKFRLWHAEVAPPSAQDQALLVVGSTVRAQCASDACGGCDACGNGAPVGHFGGIFQRILQNPWIVAGGTAAAIAIPLATDDDDAS